MYSFPPIPPYYGSGAYGRPNAYMVTQPVYHQHSVHQNGPSPHSTHPLHSVAHLVPFRRDVPRPTSWLPDEVVRDRDESIAGKISLFVFQGLR